MANRNVQGQVAVWFKGNEPTVIYADKFMVAVGAQKGFPADMPTAPGYWWGADRGWTGPFPTEQEARDAGRLQLKNARRHGR